MTRACWRKKQLLLGRGSQSGRCPGSSHVTEPVRGRRTKVPVFSCKEYGSQGLSRRNLSGSWIVLRKVNKARWRLVFMGGRLWRRMQQDTDGGER